MAESLEWLLSDAKAVDGWIKNWLYQKSDGSILAPRLLAAMEYASLNGGKRMRAGLVCASARMAHKYSHKNTADAAIGVAVAVEFLHAYSLVHDDLPAMDDADLRRGIASTHKKFDEATAILAGDALQTASFEVLCEPQLGLLAQQRMELIGCLSMAAGVSGMAGGQMLDLEAETKSYDITEVTQMQALKTGALITASAVMGGIVAGGDKSLIKALFNYAENLGIAFQITDDLLDYQGSETQLGKPVGQDNIRGKASYVEHYGLDGAAKKAQEFAEKACDSLQDYQEHAIQLHALAKFTINRTH